MTVYLKRKSFSIQEYHKLADVGILKAGDRVELINGDIIPMSPIKSPHAGMVNRLTKLFMTIFLDDKASIAIQNPIHLDNTSEPEPDIVIAQYKEDAYSSHHPTPDDIYVVIEVSDSTLQKDREIKIPLYAKANIPEYWIINLVDSQIEIHRQPKNGEYHFRQIISEQGKIEATSINLSFDYTAIFK